MNKNVDDKMELRRRNLLRFKERTDSEWQSIAKQIGVSPSDLSQRLSGSRPFTEKFARQVETRLKLSEGSLDLESFATSGRPSQNGDEGLLVRVITAIDASVKASGKPDIKGEVKYGHLVEFVYEDSKERGMPSQQWLVRLIRLILD
jgi:transcriptional regulator with XRE-family HTH domain